MSKINQFQAAEKLTILQELELGQSTRLEVAKKYDVNKNTLLKWRRRYELYGYEGLEIRKHNRSYTEELRWRIVCFYRVLCCKFRHLSCVGYVVE